MAGMWNPIGKLVHARDGGLTGAVDLPDIVLAEAATGGEKMEVKGVGVRYGVVGHFPWYGAMRLEPGALEAPGVHYKKRAAVLSLYNHELADVLGRTDKGTMSVAYSDEAVTFSVRLNSADPLAQSVWAKVQRGDVDASSVGFIPMEGDWVEGEDNGKLAEAEDEAGRTIDIFAVTQAILLEISLTPMGAFDGATSMPASIMPAAREIIRVGDVVVVGDKVSDEEAHFLAKQTGAVVAREGAIISVEKDATVEEEVVKSKDETEDGSELPAGEFEGGAGDEPGGGGETVVGAAEPGGPDGGDDRDDPVDAKEVSAEAEAEAQGLTVKDLLGTMPDKLRRRFADENRD